MKKNLLFFVLFALLATQAFSAKYQKVKKRVSRGGVSVTLTKYFDPKIWDANKLNEVAESQANELVSEFIKFNKKSDYYVSSVIESDIYTSNGEQYYVSITNSSFEYTVRVYGDGAELLYKKDYYDFNSARADYDRLVDKYLKEVFN